MPRRICAVAYTDYASDPRVRREAEALAARGDEVTVLALRREDDPAEETISGVHVVHLPVRRYRGAGVKGYLKGYASFFLKAAGYLAKHARSFDLVHAHSMPEAIVFAGIIPRMLGRKALLDVHDLSTEAYQSRVGKPPAPIKWGERAALRYASHVVTVHERYREMIIERGVRPSKVSVVLNVPDDALFGPIRPPVKRARGSTLRLVHHGTWVRRYGLELAVRAVAEARKAIPDVRFDVYGDGDLRPELSKLVAELGVTDVVSLSPGPVPVDQIGNAIQGAHAGIVPNLPDPFTVNILPTKMLEYVRLGIPVIVSRNPVIEHYFSDDMVTFVPPGDLDALTRAIEGIAADPEAAADRADRAQRFFVEHSWSRYREEFCSLVDRMATRRRVAKR
jgi:glycosyltransferase involved in cell wall biosynthesis